MKMFANLLALATLLLATQALAQQQLIPAPYPGQMGGNAQETQGPSSSYHQQLVPQPAPQAYGPGAQDNPQTTQVGGHQQIRPDPYRLDTWCNGASSCSTLR